MSKYDSIFVQSLVQIPEPIDPTTPWKDGLITFMSFGVIGFFPIFVRGVRAPISFLIHLHYSSLTNSHRCHFPYPFYAIIIPPDGRRCAGGLEHRYPVYVISTPPRTASIYMYLHLEFTLCIGCCDKLLQWKSPIRCGLEFLLIRKCRVRRVFPCRITFASKSSKRSKVQNKDL